MLVVEQLTPDQEIVDQVGHPNQSVIEDDFGVRWLLVSSSGSIPSHVWDRAALLGVMALLRPEGAGYAVALADELPEATRGQIFVPTSGWKIFDHIPNLITEVIAATEVATEEELTPEDVGLVLIHNHSEYSLLDGLPRTDEIAKKVKSDGARYVGVADHGNVAAHPDLQASCDEHGLKPVFALEAYFVDDRRKSLADFPHPEPDKTDQGAVKRYKDLREQYVKELNDYWHLVLVATNQTGLQNLWAMSTEAYRTGMRGKNARLDWEVLEQYSEGVICTTACLRGPILHNGVLDGKEDQALLRLARLKEIFGERLYLEIHTNTLPQQIEANQALVRLGKAFDVPLVVAVDAHYVNKEDVRAHRVWLSIQTNRDINDDSTLFQGEPDYYLMDEAEVRAALDYLPEEAVTESILSTAEIALQATARIDGKPTPPIFSKGGKEEDDQRLYDLCMSNWSKVLGKRYPEAVYIKRFAREFALISGKSFSGYFLMTADMTNYARDNGILVGPGRGSGAGCLVAYLANIVDVDPVDAELIFERFMTEGRTELPDFDIDYPASKKQVMQAYVRERYGDDQVTVVGSVLRLKSKGIIDKLATATRSELPEDFGVDHDALRAIITNAEADTAGLGMKWSKLNSVFEEELSPFRDKYPGFFQMADQLVERVNTFGQHAAGMVVSTGKALSTGLPMRRAKEDGHMVSQFDKDVLEALGFVKFDLLTIRNLDTIQETINLIKETTGQQIDVYDWREEYEDPQVWDEISQAHTLGLFQIETALGTQYAARMRPQQLSDLADLVTIVRPGPRNSGLTESYIKRRDGEEEITYLDPRMESFLSKTFGCMLYQEDIMQCCIVLAGYSSNEADKVRKILGKKKVAQVEAAGQEFVPRAVAHGMSQQDAEILWTQMAEFSRYSFNRAHAYSYAVLAFWCGWLKYHYPVQYLTSILSTVDKDKIPAFVEEARRMGYQVLPPDINASKHGFTAEKLAVRYGIDSIKNIGEAVADAIVQEREERGLFTSFDDFMERMVLPKGSSVNRGNVAHLAHIGAFDSLVPNRRGLETILQAEKDGTAARCVFKVDTIPVGAPNDLPCIFDWDSEPAPVNPRTGKKGKKKPPPKKCTKACRNYTAPPPPKIEDIEPYQPMDIGEIEQETLGVYLTVTPFDTLPEDLRDEFRHQAEQAVNPTGPQGIYTLPGVIVKRRPYEDRSGRKMGFFDLKLEIGTIGVTLFSSEWERYEESAKLGRLVLVELSRNSRGFTLRGMNLL